MIETAVVDNAGGVGFVSPLDKRGFELNPQAWTSMNSVRMDEGAVEPAWGYRPSGIGLGGSAHAMEFMSNQVGDDNYYIIASDAKIEMVYVATDTGIYTKEEVSVSSPYTGNYETSGDTWVTTKKDGHMVLTNGKDRPQQILSADIVSVLAEDLAGFDTQPVILSQDNYVACRTIIAFSGFLVAGWITFGNDGLQSNMIAWSDRSDTGSLPSSWDYSDTSTLAGNTTMPADYGAIVALEKIRDELMIYCERGAFRMQFTGGQYVFRIVPAYDTVGALNPRATCSHKGANIVVSYTDIVRTDGQYPESICNGTVRKELFDQLSPQNSHFVQVIEYPRKSEIIVICPNKQDDKWCGKVLAWSWITNTWTVRHGLLLRGMNTLPKLVSAIDPTNTHANSTYDDIYRSGHEPIAPGTIPPLEEYIVTDPLDPNYETAYPKLDMDMLKDKPIDNYSLVNATFGTQLADEGRQFIFGIATPAEEFFPSQPINGSNSDIYQYEGALTYFGQNPAVWLSPYV